jgi:hypothetical protein
MIVAFSDGDASVVIPLAASLLLLLPDVGPMMVVTRLFGVSGSWMLLLLLLLLLENWSTEFGLSLPFRDPLWLTFWGGE